MAQTVLPHTMTHTGHWIFHGFLIFLAAVYFLRALGLRGASCILPALGLAFSGYIFTLISAGHRNYIMAICYSLWNFGLLHRGIVSGKWRYFLLAGGATGLALSARQQDIALMFCTLAGVYALFLMVRTVPARQSGRFVLSRAAGGIIAVLLAGVLGYTGLRHLQDFSLKIRDAERGTTAQSKWIYATNWSLPPEDMLEFIVPQVRGAETINRDEPYWGRLGQGYFFSAKNWGDSQKGFHNFRQHNTYLGLVPVLLGLVSILWMCWRKSPVNLSGFPACAPDWPTRFPRLTLQNRRIDVIFWTCIFVLFALLSLGRYFPALYRVLFLIPVYNKIRAPVKWLHVSEFALCVLCAFGLAVLMTQCRRLARAGDTQIEDRDPPPKQQKAKRTKKKKKAATVPQSRTPAAKPSGNGWLLWTPVAIAGFLFLILSVNGLVAGSAPASLVSKWKAMEPIWLQQLNIQDYTSLFARNMSHAFFYAAVLALIFGIIVAAMQWGSKARIQSAVPIGLICLFGLLCFDNIRNSKKFIRVRDMRYMYAPNPVVEQIRQRQQEDKLRLSYRLAGPTRPQNPQYAPFYHQCVEISNVSPNFHDDPRYQAFYQALQQNPERLWQLTSTGYVVGPKSQYGPLTTREDFTLLDSFDPGSNGMIRREGETGKNVVFVLQSRPAPRAGFS